MYMGVKSYENYTYDDAMMLLKNEWYQDANIGQVLFLGEVVRSTLGMQKYSRVEGEEIKYRDVTLNAKVASLRNDYRDEGFVNIKIRNIQDNIPMVNLGTFVDFYFKWVIELIHKDVVFYLFNNSILTGLIYLINKHSKYILSYEDVGYDDLLLGYLEKVEVEFSKNPTKLDGQIVRIFKSEMESFWERLG